jgi:hypothetical protein
MSRHEDHRGVLVARVIDFTIVDSPFDVILDADEEGASAFLVVCPERVGDVCANACAIFRGLQGAELCRKRFE